MEASHIFAVDIGSTVVKLAHVDPVGEIHSQRFVDRNHELGIARQVEALIATHSLELPDCEVRVCSSANGGLRVGIICLSELFSGATVRNQALAAGANPLFVDSLDNAQGQSYEVDVLILGGGIDSIDSSLLQKKLECLDLDSYHFERLVYCGNCNFFDLVRQRWKDIVVVDNPLSNGLRSCNDSLFELLRRAYLDDLVYKQGISELRGNLSNGIRPTPEIVNLGFRRALLNSTAVHLIGPCLMIDIGGATTDLHYTVELVRDESPDRPPPGASVARYVFTDLGVVVSRDSALAQIRNHPRLFDFLNAIQVSEVRESYRLIREGAYDASPAFLAMTCLFIALDRFENGIGPGLPTADLSGINQIVLTGGASQELNEQQIARLLPLVIDSHVNTPEILIDRDYRVWLDGISWHDKNHQV